MIRGGFQFRASFGISVIPVTGIFCEIGLGACEDAWSLPAMLACYHGLCNQAKEKRTCGALPLGPKETHHKLEAEGKGGVVLSSGTVVPDLIIGHFRYLFS